MRLSGKTALSVEFIVVIFGLVETSVLLSFRYVSVIDLMCSRCPGLSMVQYYSYLMERFSIKQSERDHSTQCKCLNMLHSFQRFIESYTFLPFQCQMSACLMNTHENKN